MKTSAPSTALLGSMALTSPLSRSKAKKFELTEPKILSKRRLIIFSKPLFTIVTFLGYIASAVFLSFALKKLPLGTAYAMWTGFGIVGTQVLGILLFQERLSLPQAVCVLLIVAGIAGLKVLSND